MYFTYRIKWSKLDISYYGVRYKDNITPQSLMTTYFTSSVYVKDFIKENGAPDIIQIRKTFTDKVKAKKWEEKGISKGKLYLSDKWLNKGNNNSFKGVVMDNDIRRLISKKRKEQEINNKMIRGKKKIYNNGETNKYFYENDTISTEWKLGILKSEKMKSHIEKLNRKNKNMTEEQKNIKSQKLSESKKGISKPEGFGDKISKYWKGRKRPNQTGANNPSCSHEARKKISESWKNREKGKWIYSEELKEKYYIKESEHSLDSLINQGYKLGRPLGYKSGRL